MNPGAAGILLTGCAASQDGLLLGLGWSEIATVVAAALAAAVAVYGYSRQQRAARRDQRAAGYAEALRAVEDYLEAPYLIRRRDGSPAARRAVTDHISGVQSRIKLHESWLAIHSPAAVKAAYADFVTAARTEAGAQMTAAWRRRPTTRDRDVPIGTAYPSPRSDAARHRIVEAMRRDLKT